MATVEITVAAQAGQPATHEVNYTAALSTGDDYTISNDGRTFLLARKASGTASVITFSTTKQVQGLDVEDPTVSAPSSEDARLIGPFPIDLYGDEVAISGITNVAGLTLAAFRI